MQIWDGSIHSNVDPPYFSHYITQQYIIITG
jgi:hypothetical protein